MSATSAPLAQSKAPSKALHVALWVAQIALAAMFIMAGSMKLTTPIAELEQAMSAPRVLGGGMIRFIGTAELFGAVGVVLPALTRIKPTLTPIAASALALVMALAAVYHLTQGELGAVPVNIALGAVAAFVAWGRFRGAPIRPR